MAESVIVACRCRPFNAREKEAGHTKISTIKGAQISLQNPKSEKEDLKTFTFDALFDEDCTQIGVYNSTARTIVDAVLNGFNGTVLAYGQTGTGKTFSMQGLPDNPDLRGIIPNCFHHIFDHISSTPHKQYMVRASYLEIYNEEIIDLLVKPDKNAKGGLDLREFPDVGVFVQDLSAFVVKSVKELDQIMTIGNKNRSVGATLMNETSSRSHSIFTITIESSEKGLDGQDKYVVGKLNLVDLAGSERQTKTGASGERLKEATKINLSLSALGNCISALVDGKSTHIPYRDSKLTRLLQDSLGGNAKTLMIATLSPASYNYEETLSTLRYANRTKSIKNKPIVNEDPKDTMLREHKEEIERLKKALEARRGGGGVEVVKKVVRKVKKVKRKNKDGTTAIEDSGDEIEEGDEIDALAIMDEDTISLLQQQVQEEKKKLLASKDIVIEEKNRIVAELEAKAQALEKERQERENLANQLNNLQAKLLIGGVNIFEKVSAQERELQEAQARLYEQRHRELELQQQLEAKQETQLQLEENFSSLQEEVDVKTQKLKKLWQKFQEVKAEIADCNDEFRIEKEDILDALRAVSMDLSLKQAIIDNFIPKEEYLRTEKRISYKSEIEDWEVIVPIHTLQERIDRQCSAPGIKRPICQYAKIALAMGDPNPRYRPDNLINVSLELPERTTIAKEVPRNGNVRDIPVNVISAQYMDDNSLGSRLSAYVDGSNAGLESSPSRTRRSDSNRGGSASPSPTRSASQNRPGGIQLDSDGSDRSKSPRKLVEPRRASSKLAYETDIDSEIQRSNSGNKRPEANLKNYSLVDGAGSGLNRTAETNSSSVLKAEPEFPVSKSERVKGRI